MKACFMGLGYIGLPTAIIAAKHGIQITGVDINPHVVKMTNAGHLHIIEPGMEEMLQEVVKAGMLKASVTPVKLFTDEREARSILRTSIWVLPVSCWIRLHREAAFSGSRQAIITG